MLDDRNEALADLGHALGRVVTAALADLPTETGRVVCEAINAAEGKLQILINFEPFCVFGSIVSTTTPAERVPLFKVIQPSTLN